MSELNNKASLNSICHDFFLFQDSLKKLRVLDDKIIYTLNSSLPTDSFKTAFDGEQSCKQLHTQVSAILRIFTSSKFSVVQSTEHSKLNLILFTTFQQQLYKKLFSLCFVVDEQLQFQRRKYKSLHWRDCFESARTQEAKVSKPRWHCYPAKTAKGAIITKTVPNWT